MRMRPAQTLNYVLQHPWMSFTQAGLACYVARSTHLEVKMRRTCQCTGYRPPWESSAKGVLIGNGMEVSGSYKFFK
jgi:hypothetical protein